VNRVTSSSQEPSNSFSAENVIVSTRPTQRQIDVTSENRGDMTHVDQIKVVMVWTIAAGFAGSNSRVTYRRRP
jgi:hypothetical protein